MSEKNESLSTGGEGKEQRELPFEEGKPTGPDRWRDKLKTRGDILKYLCSAERYWCAGEGFGSEKRRTPA